MASSILNKQNGNLKKIDDLCNWEFIHQSDVVDDDADLLIYAEVHSLDSVSIFSADDESEDVKSVDLTSDFRDVLYDDDVVMAGSSPDANLKFTMPPSATAVDDDDLEEEEEEEDSQYSDDDQEEEEEEDYQYSDDDHEVEEDDEDLADKLYLKLQEIRHAQAVHAGLAPHDNHNHDVAVNFPGAPDVMKNQIHQDIDHVSLSNGYDHHHDDSETDHSNGQDKRRGIVFHIRLPPNYRYNLDLNSEPISTDYDDASDEDEDDDDEYDLDDELVPRDVAGKLERQRMRKLGRRACSKITRSKRLVLQYSKPGCVRGKHGLGLKANC